MRCPLCRVWVGLQATTCACGFDVATGEVGKAMKQARRDLGKGVLHLLIGLAAIGALATTVMYPALFLGVRSMRLIVALVAISIYGVGRGGWLLLDARRRLAVADRMRQPPEARVVQRGRTGGSAPR